MLNTIIVYYNFCNYKSRYEVAKKFIDKYNNTLNLYIVELILENQNFEITNENNKNHLQLKTKYFLWYKENLINIAINKLLPKDWQYVSWIDCNLEFENEDFIEKTLDKLQQYDFVQMFSMIKYCDINNNIIETYKSFIYSVFTECDLSSKPGGAWACTKKGYEKIGKLFDVSLCESDCILAHALGLKQNYYKNKKSEYVKLIDGYIQNIINNNICVSFANNILLYHWHGNQENRNYHIFRKNMIMKYNYNPEIHIKYNNEDLIIPTMDCPFGLLEYIEKYYYSRKEDIS
jgi:hypothetical protein